MTEREEEKLYRTGVCNMTCPADHPKWPVSCGKCGKRCDGAQVSWSRYDLGRAVAVTVYLCYDCGVYGLVIPIKGATTTDQDTWRRRIRYVKSAWNFRMEYCDTDGRRLTPVTEEQLDDHPHS